jgi:hypothetical protein
MYPLAQWLAWILTMQSTTWTYAQAVNHLTQTVSIGVSHSLEPATPRPGLVKRESPGRGSSFVAGSSR